MRVRFIWHAGGVKVIEIDIRSVTTNHLIDTRAGRRQIKAGGRRNLREQKAKTIELTDSVKEIALLGQLLEHIGFCHHQPMVSLNTERIFTDPGLNIGEQILHGLLYALFGRLGDNVGNLILNLLSHAGLNQRETQ